MKRFCYALWVFAALFACAIWSGNDCSDGEIEKSNVDGGIVTCGGSRVAGH